MSHLYKSVVKLNCIATEQHRY